MPNPEKTLEEPVTATLPLEADPALAERISALVEESRRDEVLSLVSGWHPADLAQLISHLSEEEGQALFEWLQPERAGEVLAELDTPERTELLENLPAAEITTLLNELDTDDAADVIAALPEEIAQEVLPQLEDSEEVEELLSYGEESAGGIMSSELVAVLDSWTVSQATEEVRRQAELVEPIFQLYAVDEANHLRGIVPLEGLLLSPAHTPIRDVMDTEILAVGPEVDQEEVARIMERYDLVSLPVIDRDGRILGHITIDDVVDVIREEAEEDIHRISGLAPGGEELSDSVLVSSRGRLPWLLLGLAGTILAGLVVRSFERSLEEALVLAAFIPIMTAMAGNAAIQSAAITVQGLASGRLWDREMLSRVGKELLVAAVNGLCLALVLAGVIIVTQFAGPHSMRLSLVAALALFVVIILATTNGALVPVVLQRLGIDPAISMGPFVTTSNDIVGLTVYFLIATLLYL